MLHDFFNRLQMYREAWLHYDFRMLQETKKDPESHVTDYRGHFVANVAEAELQCTLFTHYLNSN